MYEEFSYEELGPHRDFISRTLDESLNAPALRLSDRNRRFLTYVVMRTLDGLSESIKGYTIGVDVFGREASFDPDSDPIVRIEAARVRAALAAYYEQPGSGIFVRISLPQGRHVPTFSWIGSVRP